MSEPRGYESPSNHQDMPPLPNPNRPQYENPDQPVDTLDDMVAPRTSDEQYHIPDTEPTLVDRTVETLKTGEIPVDDEKRMSFGKKVIVGLVTAAGLAGGIGAGVAAVNSQSHDSNPAATSTPNPGEAPSTAEAPQPETFDKYTLEDFPFEINGEKVVGIEEFREKYGIDGATHPDAPSITQGLVDQLNKLAYFAYDEENRKYYEGYYNLDTGVHGALGVFEDYVVPALRETWGATREKIINPNAVDDWAEGYYKDLDNTIEPIIQEIRSCVKGNLENNGLCHYEVVDTVTRAKAHGFELKPVPGVSQETDTEFNNESFVTVQQGDSRKINEKFTYAAFRVPVGDKGRDQILFGYAEHDFVHDK